MATTHLTPIATPGRPYSFSPKGIVATKGVGPFTALSVMALPGMRHTFIAKGVAEETGGIGSLAQYGGTDMIALEDEELMELIPMMMGVINN